MGVWIEIRCSDTGETSAGTKFSNERCLSERGDGPMELSDDNHVDVLMTLRMLAQSARARGWKKTKCGWICPVCYTRNCK